MAKPKIRRLFFDIETSPNVVYSWSVGYKINIDHDNIVKERAIVCIAWKWEGEREVHALHWDSKHNDKRMLQEFIPILESADEIVAHYGDRFDIPWVRARAAFHGLRLDPYIKTIDTKAQSARNFYFNSNRLDYLGHFLGVGRKIKTDFDLWKDVMAGDEQALERMIAYNKQDVRLLERVYQRLEPYNKPKSHVGVMAGLDRESCPSCGSEKTQRRGYRVSASGNRTQIRSCRACGRNFSAPPERKPKMKKCKAADKYKAVYPPRCNEGNPCEACLAKWRDK